MKILFTLLHLPEKTLVKEKGLYIDLAKEFAAKGHEVTLIGSSQVATRLNIEGGMRVLRVKSGRIIGESNLTKKGIAMAILPMRFKKIFYRYFKNCTFDWIILPTPPITLIDFVIQLKQKTQAQLYLLLRDIHPQSSWSLGVIPYRWMYNYLDRRSRKGYEAADIIGCMSQKNIEFILEEYPSISPKKMTVLLNWMQPPNNTCNKSDVRKRFSLENKTIVLFGGNIGLGQRIENIVDLAEHYQRNSKVKFVIIGKGIKKDDLKKAVYEKKLNNVLFLDYMPQDEYLNFIRNVDIGLISINENNATPTCPSKLASYMSMKIPVLAMINKNNDYGQMIDSAGAGFWAVGSDKKKIYEEFDKLINNPDLRKTFGENGFHYFLKNMTTEIACDTMLSQMEQIK